LKILFFRETELQELNPDVMKKRGLAGTEKSLISLAQELSKFHTVKVIAPQRKQCFYENVEYIPFQSYAEVLVHALIFEPDILIVVANPSILFDFNFECKTIFWHQNHPEELLDSFLMDLLIDNPLVIAPSPEAAEYYNKFYHTDKIIGIYNGVQENFFNRIHDPVKNKIVYCGAFYPTKGLNIFLQASKKLPELNFFCCGSFDLYGNISNTAFETYCKSIADDSKNVYFLGNLTNENLANCLSTAAMCVVNPLVDNKETCCCSALEAIVVGAPVISGDSEILNKIVKHGGTPTKDLPKTILEVLSDQRTYDNKYDNKDFIENLRWSKITTQWNRVFNYLKC
jgi:glycosyltransferase involved in cell wall biosynthesis